MKEEFKRKCALLKTRSDILYDLLENLKQQLILQDLSKEFGVPVKKGRHFISGFDWIEEIDVEGESFNLISKAKNKYYSYVVYTEKDYHTIGLGFMYKGELISPHVEISVNDIISRYSDEELNEISMLIDENIANINKDIEFLTSNNNIKTHNHYYGEYNKGFNSHYRYETISNVIENFKEN